MNQDFSRIPSGLRTEDVGAVPIAGPSKDGIEETLANRQTTHGSYKDNAEFSQQLKDIFRAHPGWQRLSPRMRETYDMIIHKMARTMNGNPFVADHWHDLAGYATLVEKECEE